MSYPELHPERWQRYQGDPMEDGLLFVIRLGPDLEAIAFPESPPTGPLKPRGDNARGLWNWFIDKAQTREPPEKRGDRVPPGERRVPRLAPIALVGVALGIALAFWGFWVHNSRNSSGERVPAVVQPTPPEPPPKKRLSKKEERDQILDLLKGGKFKVAEAELREALRAFPGDQELEELSEGLHQGLSLKRLKFRYQTKTEEKEILVPAGDSEFNLTSKEGIALVPEDNFCIEFIPAEDCYLYIYQIDSHGQFYWLFPNREVSPLGNPVQAGRTYRLPGTEGSCIGGGQWLGLDEEPGTEEVFLVASRWQAHDLEQTLGKLAGFQKASPQGTSSEPLLEELEERVAARDRDQRSARTGAYFSRVVTFEHRSLGRLVEKIR